MTIRLRPAVALVFTLLRVAVLTVAIRPAAAQLVPGPAEGYLIITTDAPTEPPTGRDAHRLSGGSSPPTPTLEGLSRQRRNP